MQPALWFVDSTQVGLTQAWSASETHLRWRFRLVSVHREVTGPLHRPWPGKSKI